ncbi:D-inositol-3-phosphate glycosyltransferase [subsurface metagenome]
MKILMANSFHYYRGGDCIYTFQVTGLLQQMGDHKVVNFAMKHPLNLPCKYSEFFVPQIDFPKELAHRRLQSGIRVLTRFIYSNVAMRNLSRLLDKYPVDIAHIQNIHGCITPSIFEVLKARNIPIVWTLHDYKLLCPNIAFFSKGEICEACKSNKFYSAVLRKCRKDSCLASFLVMIEAYIHRLLGLLKLVDFFITPSQFMRKKMIEYGFSPERVVHIPHFIDVKHFSPSLSTYSNDYIVYVGRLSYEKGITTLIKSVLDLNSIKLLIVGDGPMRSVLEKQVGVDDQKNRIKFLGAFSNRNKLKNIIYGAAFVVFPSECYETFGLAIVEGHALGKPVIGANIGCIPELVKDGETGLLFEPGNADDLAEKIQWMVENPKERQAMGLRARELVEKECNPELHYKRLIAVYETALRKHGKGIDELLWKLR